VKSRSTLPLLAALLLALGLAGQAAAQIPGLPRPGGGRSRGETRPPNEGRPPQRAGQPQTRDTVPGGRPATPEVQDTLIERLLRLEGYTPVEYQADSAEYRSSDRTLRLRGDSRVQRNRDLITAEDSIVYREQSDFVAAYGNPQGSPETGEPISGDVFFYDLAARRATVRGARTKITESATWFVQGDVTDERGQRIYAENSQFTSDDREEPAYHFKADKIMIIRNRILVGRPAYLYFKNVPVMALPFIVQDLESGRRSGVLIPSFEINDIIRTNSAGRDSRGTGREISNIGYYWAVNQYLGLQLAGRWRSQTYTALSGDLDFNFRQRFLNGSLAFERFWETEGPARLTLDGNARWQASERLDLTGSVRYASSSRFERNRTVDPYRQVEDLSSNFAATRRFDWGQLSLNAERRQSIANDDVNFTPRFSLAVNPINILPSVVLNVNVNGSQTSNSPGDALRRRIQPTSNASAGGGLGLTIGDLSVSSSLAYQRQSLDLLRRIPTDSLELGVDTSRARELFGQSSERVGVTVSTAYQIPLFASTRLSPSISFSRELARIEDTRFDDDEALGDSLQGVYGTYVSGPTRLNVGASLSTDLYGFFPGFADYTAIRHHIQPQIGWRYSPAGNERDEEKARIQRRVFGASQLQTQNIIELTLNQTFEAKVRDPEPVQGPPAADSAARVQQGDSAAAGGGISQGNAARPAEPRKITLLSINTSALAYSFEPLDSLGTRFRNDDISNSIRTDLLGGLQFTVTHDLFDERLETVSDSVRRTRRGAFSPFLTSFNTSFSLGQNSAIFRWLGFSRATEEERRTERGQTPDSAGVRPTQPPGGATMTGNNQQAGGGPWNLSLSYSLARSRRSVRDTIPGLYDRGNSTLGGTLTFSPTRNWGVSWNTQYSMTENEFSVHRINLKRDLYRWQANFDYILAPNGNTSFSFSVHLTDLPDLKADYNERSLGVDRPESSNGGASFNRTPVALPPPPPPAARDTGQKTEP
jgi:hypothetical protein